jgi:membrane protein
MNHRLTDVFQIVWKFIWQLVARIIKHDIASLAAVISFYAFFSLFPLLILVIYGVTALLPGTPTEKLIVHLIEPYFPGLPEAQDFMQRNIVRLSSLGARVGWVSAITLTWSATSGFIAVQQALDVIWESAQRSFVTRRVIAFGMLVVLLLFALGSAMMTTLYPWVKEGVASHVPRFIQLLSYLHGLSKIIFPASLFLVFLVFYRYLPSNTRETPWAFLIPGALVATVTVDAGRIFFVWYANHLVRYQMIYGTLAAAMLLVLWTYVAGMLMLFGAEVSATLQSLQQERKSTS